MAADVDVDDLLNECLTVVAVEVRRMRGIQDGTWKPEPGGGARLGSAELHAIAKLTPVLQQIAMVRLDPFGDLAKMRRALRDAKEISAAQK